MKGGEGSMLHIILDKGIVVDVIELGKNPGEFKHLEEEFDYKVEDLDQYRIMDKDNRGNSTPYARFARIL